MESFSKFLFIQFFLIDEKFGSNIVEHFEGANNIGFQHNLLLNLIAIVSCSLSNPIPNYLIAFRNVPQNITKPLALSCVPRHSTPLL